MSYDFILHVHGKIEPLRYDVSVSILAGDIITVNIVIRACSVALPSVMLL